LLKSSRFEIARSGSNFIFRGSGFGHGLGLCQEGAHVMALRGVNYRQILAKYFPGTSVSQRGNDRVATLPLDKKTLSSQRKAFALKDCLTTKNSIALKNPPAAWPAHSAARLRLAGQLLSSSSEATPCKRGVASKLFEYRPERRSLSALCGGKAANNPDYREFIADLIWNPSPPSPETRRTLAIKRTYLSSEHFRVSYPFNLPQSEVEGILKTLETTRASLLRRITAAGVSLNQIPITEIFINGTTGDFVGRTGQPWWAAAATKGNLIEIQPLAVLKRRRVLDTTLRHEWVHILIDKLSHGRAPRWLAEGTAIYFAGEGPLVARFAPETQLTVDQIDKTLGEAGSANEMRAAYAAAYREVSNLIKREGEAKIWRRAAGS
ncbi:MAG: hypothetical protein M3R68_07090, partial [Acidobacteriota bacterium]|nr:hypothetical protein [Acidobacteriota bacterium]